MSRCRAQKRLKNNNLFFNTTHIILSYSSEITRHYEKRSEHEEQKK